MVLISDEVISIFKILSMDVTTEQQLFSALIPRDLLLRVDVEQDLTNLIETLKGKYKSSKLNCLHKNRDDKQKFPGINLVRQILRCNGYHLKPKIYSRGYCKHSGKKIVDRNFTVVRLDNYGEIKIAEQNVKDQTSKIEQTKNNNNNKNNYVEIQETTQVPVLSQKLEIEMLEDIDTSLEKTNSEYTDEIISLMPQSKTQTQNQNSETQKDNIECASSNLIKSIELNF